MTGWFLVISLLLLGGVLSTLGDMLGSYIGKSRLSIFNLRPRRTAVLITVLTGSLISSISFGFMLLVNKELRVGLFELNQLQAERELLDRRISQGEIELRELEKNLIALRRGNVVVTTGQILAINTINLSDEDYNKFDKFIQRLLQKANLEGYRLLRPGDRPNRQIILVPRLDIKKLKNILIKNGKSVVSIRSAANVISGEKLIYAFPEVRENKIIVEKGEIIASTTLDESELTKEEITKSIRLLLASSLAEVKRRGSLSQGIQFDTASVNSLGNFLKKQKRSRVEIQAVAIRQSETADQISIDLKSNMIPLYK